MEDKEMKCPYCNEFRGNSKVRGYPVKDQLIRHIEVDHRDKLTPDPRTVTREGLKMHQVTEDTIVGYDNQGNEIRAEQLQRWAYNQLAAALELLEALKELVASEKHRTTFRAEQVLAKAEGK